MFIGVFVDDVIMTKDSKQSYDTFALEYTWYTISRNELLWIYQEVMTIGVKIELPMRIIDENQDCVDNSIKSIQDFHFDIRYHFILIWCGSLVVSFIRMKISGMLETVVFFCVQVRDALKRFLFENMCAWTVTRKVYDSLFFKTITHMIWRLVCRYKNNFHDRNFRNWSKSF